MLSLKNFYVDKKCRFSEKMIFQNDYAHLVNYLKMTYSQLQGFKMLESETENHGIWKNGNVYLKKDDFLILQAFIGQKLNELKCPNFCYTFGILVEKLVPFSPTEYYQTTIIERGSKYNQHYLCTQEGGELDFSQLITEIHQRNIEEQEKLYLSIFIQIVMGLYAAYKKFNFSHGDLHHYNVCYRRYTGWLDICGETVYSEGYLPVMIDFGSSFMKIGKKIYSSDDYDIIVHNNHPDKPNNIGDIFRVYYFLFLSNGQQYPGVQELRKYLCASNFNMSDVMDLTRSRMGWFTPRIDANQRDSEGNKNFDFDKFVKFLKKTYPEYFASISYHYQLEKAEMKLEEDRYYPEGYLYEALLKDRNGTLMIVEKLVRSAFHQSRREACIFNPFIEILQNLVEMYPLPRKSREVLLKYISNYLQAILVGNT